jgi:hypothetical protein
MWYFPVICLEVFVSNKHPIRLKQKMVDIALEFKHTKFYKIWQLRYKFLSRNSFLYSEPFRQLFRWASESDLTLFFQGENATTGNLDRD